MYGQDFAFDAYFDANFLDEQKVKLEIDDALKDFGEDYNDVVYDYLNEFESEQTSSSGGDDVLPEYLNDASTEAFVPAPTVGSQAEYAEFMEATIRENVYILEWMVHQGGQDLQQWQTELEKSKYELRQLNQDRELLCLYPDLSEENFELLPVNPQKDGDKVETADSIEVILGDTSLAKTGLETIAEEDEDGDDEEEKVVWEDALDSSNGPKKSDHGDSSEDHSLDAWRAPTLVQLEPTSGNYLLEKLRVFYSSRSTVLNPQDLSTQGLQTLQADSMNHNLGQPSVSDSSKSDGDHSGYHNLDAWRPPTLVQLEPTSGNYLLERLHAFYSSRSTVPNPQDLSTQRLQTLQADSNDTLNVTEKPFMLPASIQEPEIQSTAIFDNFVTDMWAAIIEAEEECRYDSFAKDLIVVLQDIEGEMNSASYPRDMEGVQATYVDMSGIGQHMQPMMQSFAGQQLYDTITTVRYDYPKVQRRNSKGSKSPKCPKSSKSSKSSKDEGTVAKALHKIKEYTTVVRFYQDGNNQGQEK